MIEIDAPIARQVEVPLEPEDVYRHEGLPPTPPVITLGEPVVIALTRAMLKKDPEALASLDQHPDQAFFLVKLACTFRPRDGDTISEAWLRVQLDPQSAIAWSMLPQRDADIDESSSKLSLGGELKLLGIKAGAEQTVPIKRVRPFIDALNLLQNDPSWQFKPNAARELSGSFPLALVVRSPRKGGGGGTVSLRCAVERTRFMMVTFVSPAQAPREMTFSLHA